MGVLTGTAVALTALQKGLIIGGGAAAGGAAFRLIPNKFERQYRRQVKEMGKQLARGEGGMSEAERQEALARGAQQVEAATAQQQAMLARGAASGQGASGMREQAIRDLSQGKQQARGQISTAIQKQDMALREAMKQQYMAGLGDLASRQQLRKSEASRQIQAYTPAVMNLAGQAAAEKRPELGEALQSASGALQQGYMNQYPPPRQAQQF
jgi:hypothetical protein